MPKITDKSLVEWLNKYPLAMQAFEDDKGDDPEEYLASYGHIEDLADRVYSDLLNYHGVDQLPEPGATEPTQEELLKLWEHTRKFITEQEINCSEIVYQSDNVIENAYEFIDGAAQIVGFHAIND